MIRELFHRRPDGRAIALDDRSFVGLAGELTRIRDSIASVVDDCVAEIQPFKAITPREAGRVLAESRAEKRRRERRAWHKAYCIEHGLPVPAIFER